MANSVCKSPYGPLWPLGLTTVATSGTPVNIMTAVDASLVNKPETTNQPQVAGQLAYSVNAYDIIIQPIKSTGPVVANTGSIYVILANQGGTGNKTDTGSLLMTIPQTSGAVHLMSVLGPARINPYDIVIDADNNGDGCVVTLVIG